MLIQNPFAACCWLHYTLDVHTLNTKSTPSILLIPLRLFVGTQQLKLPTTTSTKMFQQRLSKCLCILRVRSCKMYCIFICTWRRREEDICDKQYKEEIDIDREREKIEKIKRHKNIDLHIDIGRGKEKYKSGKQL